VASIAVIDDALGTNTVTLTGPDALMFETTEGQLYLRPGIDFDYGVKKEYIVIVSARDASLIGSTPVSDRFTLSIDNDPAYHGREYLEPTSGETVTDTTIRSGVVQLIKREAGTTILTAASTHAGGTMVEAGEVVVRDTGALGSGRLTVKSGATVQFDVHSGNVAMGGLTVEPGGRIEIGYGRFTVPQGVSPLGYSLPTIRQQLLGGFLNNWVGVDGYGTRSAGSVQGGNVGYIVNGDKSITVGFAANGDTNLDGMIDLLDLSNFIASGKFDKGTASDWVDGDFNYDGIVDILDATSLISTGLVDAGAYIPAASPSATAAGTLSTLSPTEAAFLSLVANDASAASTSVKKVRFAKL
jgi:autotransporter-associated beta strand protein